MCIPGSIHNTWSGKTPNPRRIQTARKRTPFESYVTLPSRLATWRRVGQMNNRREIQADPPPPPRQCSQSPPQPLRFPYLNEERNSELDVATIK
jgi:hypothetical protein